MFDFARISKMLEYQKQGVWPLLPVTGISAMKIRVRLLRIALGRLPQDIYGTRVFGGIGHLSNTFRLGTRGWEYPWVLEQLADLPLGTKILDCGCGISKFPEELWRRGFVSTGLDLFVDQPIEGKPGYGITRTHRDRLGGRVEFLNGDMQNIPSPDDMFDVVTCISVMEHIVIEHRYDPAVHLRCLAEMRRVLKPNGRLICTYDTPLNPKVVYGGTTEWGENGWYYADDIAYLQMPFVSPKTRVARRDEILLGEDTFFVPPDIYLSSGYGHGFEDFGPYHRLTSIGFALLKS